MLRRQAGISVFRERSYLCSVWTPSSLSSVDTVTSRLFTPPAGLSMDPDSGDFLSEGAKHAYWTHGTMCRWPIQFYKKINATVKWIFIKNRDTCKKYVLFFIG